MPIGCKVTLRRQRMYEFLDRLINVALPRVRDFRGISGKSFDGRGNFALGLKEQIVFPEIDYDRVDAVRGMNVVVTTTAQNRCRGKGAAQGFRHAVCELTEREFSQMAKKSSIEKNARRIKLAKQHRVRDAPGSKQIAIDRTAPPEERFAAQLKLAELPRNSSPTRVRNRCALTGRPRGYYRKFKLSRIALRELASSGQIPGMLKSSW